MLFGAPMMPATWVPCGLGGSGGLLQGDQLLDRRSQLIGTLVSWRRAAISARLFRVASVDFRVLAALRRASRVRGLARYASFIVELTISRILVKSKVFADDATCLFQVHGRLRVRGRCPNRALPRRCCLQFTLNSEFAASAFTAGTDRSSAGVAATIQGNLKDESPRSQSRPDHRNLELEHLGTLNDVVERKHIHR